MALKMGDETGVMTCALGLLGQIRASSPTMLFLGISMGEVAATDALTSLDADLALGEMGGWYEAVATLAPPCKNSLKTKLLPRATAT